MFDVGFSELLMVGLVALLVLGPEKLPKAARIAGFWLGKARSTMATVKTEIRQELHAEEMRQLLKQQLEHLEANDLQQTLKNDAEAASAEINAALEAISDTSSVTPIENHDEKPAGH
jgi:sec-independent protein translocase protein TatB